jgi:hypothetical protein
MPGEIPFAWIERPEGVKVTRSGQRKRSTFAAKGNQRLHRAFAEGRVPTIVTRLWSCKAPATISEAEAESPLINAITGFPSLISLPAPALKI